MIAGHAALLAWKSGKPVKMIYGRSEDMAATTKRHPSRTRHRTAVSRDGRLLGDGHRLHDRRRRLLHAVAGRPVARHDSRRRTVCLPERARSRARGGDQRAAARRVPRLRRAAEHLRARAAHGQGGGGGRPDAGRPSAPQLHQAGRYACRSDRRSRNRSTWPRCSIARSTATELPRKAGALRAREPGTARSRRGSASRPSCTAPASPDRARCTCSRWSTVEGDARRHGARAGREHGDRPGHQHHLLADRRRGARHRRATTSTSSSPTRRWCPTAGRPSRRARAWSSASSSSRRRSA